MSIQALGFAEPFFTIKYLQDEAVHAIGRKSIVFNLSSKPIIVKQQLLGFFRSAVFTDMSIFNATRCLVIEDFERHTDHDSLFQAIRKKWTLVYDATGVERHKGVQLWRSPKEKIGDTEVNMCFAASIPLNVGLHRTHWGDRPFKEVHTQILGFGIMQQYSEQDLSTLYREDPMSPGCTHEPMYDQSCVYPWHQYETVSPAIFMATEMQMTEEEYIQTR